MSDRKRFNIQTSNLNSTFIRKPYASNNSPFINAVNRTYLNETVYTSSLPNEIPAVKASISSGVIETELTYNDYLQSLMKYQITQEYLKEQKNTLQGQILLQQDHFSKRTDVLKQIKSDTERLIMKEEIVKMIKTLEENISSIQRVYSNYQIQKHIENVQVALQEKTKVLTLKNVQPVVSQDQYYSLIESLKKLISACEKIINCGRDFEGVHNLAEDCRHLSQIGKKIRESQRLLSTMETHTVNTLLQKLSDTFAKKYEHIYH